MNLSIIIVNYNSKEVIFTCLKSIVQSVFGLKYEVIIIDNASKEKLEEIDKEFSAFAFIYNKKNIGFAAANNIGIKKTKGKYILLLNPDTIVNKNSFIPMIDYLDSHNDVGIVGCKIFNSEGEIEHSTHSFPNLIKEFVHANEFFKKLFGYNSLFMKWLSIFCTFKSVKSYWEHNSIREVDHVTGACMMIKREAIEKVGLLDEAFFLYNEEVEWSYRMKEAGYKSVFLPHSSIIHLFGFSTKQKVQKQKVNYLLLERYRGMFYFFQKHYGFIRLILLRLIVIQGFALRLLIEYFRIFLANDQGIREEIVFTKRIILLSFKNNFDWRKSR